MSDIAKKYVHVGDKLHVQGEIQHKKMETGERAGQYSYSILAHDLKFIPSGKKASNAPTTEGITIPVQNDDTFDDDAIPF
jgi:single-stranded DNA-binding protein